MTRARMIEEIETAPESVLPELLGYLHFLKARAQQERAEPALMNTPALAINWLRPEEDAAWADL